MIEIGSKVLVVDSQATLRSEYCYGGSAYKGIVSTVIKHIHSAFEDSYILYVDKNNEGKGCWIPKSSLQLMD